MDRDDYFVVAYQVLKYLYDCLKRGTPPILSLLCGETFGIEESYFEYILRTLKEDGYINGIAIFTVLGRISPGVKVGREIEITPKGIEYLQDNTKFKKVKGTVKELIDLLPL